MATRKHKCEVCGLYLWGSQRHSGAIHDRIRAARRRRIGVPSSAGLLRRLRRHR